MKKIFFNIFTLLLINSLFSQGQAYYETYDWDPNPKYTVSNFENQEMIAVKDKVVNEFYFVDNNSLVEFSLEHKVLWLNADQKIEDFNKVYLPYKANSELMVSKARVITKEGKILNLDDSKILTAQDEETKRTYKYFAFEGVEKGSFIEYFYVLKQYPVYKGRRITLQDDFAKQEVDFEVFAPKNLIFEFKSYNGLPEVTKDTLTPGKLHWHLHLNALKALDKEEESAYNASKKHVVYKLDRNLIGNVHNISSYSIVSQNIYTFFYTEKTKKLNSSIENLIKAEKFTQLKDDGAKINAIETYIKSNYYISDVDSNELEDLETILNTKVGNTDGIIRLYIALLESLNIKHEIVLTSNRFNTKFDKNFEALNFLTDYLIYFPTEDKYLSPENKESRFRFPPYSLTGNYGLFIKEVKLGDFKSGVGEIKYINPVEAEESADNLEINIEFDKEDLTKTKIDLTRSLSGYYAMFIQPYMHVMKEEDKEKFIEMIVKSIHEDTEIIEGEILNGTPELFGLEPVGIKAKIESDYFVEKAGGKYLFKIGELIGPQLELYQEKERVLPVESEFMRSYHRIINIEIPDHMKITNLNDISINNFYEKDGKKLMLFESTYTLDGKKLQIKVDEYYKLNYIEPSIYNEYRKVINSAADFNKITLIFEPEG